MEIKWRDIIRLKWFKRLYFLYIFGFCANFRLATPYIYEFLISYRQFPKSEIIEDIFPVLFYSTAAQLLPVFLFADLFRFNPFIIISALTGIVSTCLYIWTSSLTELQIAEAFSGSVIATEVAYYASVYVHGDVKNFQRLTSYVRAAPLGAQIISKLLAQLFISQEWLNYKDLYYFDLAALIVATIVSIFLPPVSHEEKEKSKDPPLKFCSIPSNFIHSFPNKYVVKWSFWSVLTICGYNQVSVYVHVLWNDVQDANNITPYNGVIDAVYAVFALIGTVLGGHAVFDWKFKGDLILAMASMVQAFMVIFMSQLHNVLLKCTFYIFFGFMYHFTMTILCGEIAKFLNRSNFGLVFGFIALVAAVLNSGMVCLLNDKVGFQVEPQALFMAYGYYHFGISVLFIFLGLVYWFAKHTYPV